MTKFDIERYGFGHWEACVYPTNRARIWLFACTRRGAFRRGKRYARREDRRTASRETFA